MKKIFLFLIIISSGVFQGNKIFSQAVPPATVMQYLKSKINIYFINDPNTNSPAIHRISNDSISNNTNGVLFGRGGNNAMTQSARLLLSLFKDRSRRPGDGRLQDFVYQLIKLRDKSIDIYFLNDQLHSIDPAYMAQYGFLDTFRVGSNLHVWPTTVMPVNETSAGTILIGEKIFRGFNELKQSKSILLDLLTSVAIADYREMHKFWVFWHEISRGDTLRYTFSMMDSRQKTNQGICNAVRFAYDIEERNGAFRWYPEKQTLVKWSSVPRDTRSNPIMPAQFWLYDEMQADELLSRARALTSPAFNARMGREYRQTHFNTGGPTTVNPEIHKYAGRDEMMLGLMNEAAMRFLDIPRYWEALKYNNNRFFTAEPQNRLAILIENIYFNNLGGRTAQQLRTNPPADKKYLLGIALFDFFSNYGSGGEGQELNRWMLGGTISQELLDLYRPIRPQLMAATSAAASQGIGAQTQAIRNTLQIN
jgi:hypothetical protein